MPLVKLTDLTLRAIKPPPQGQVTYWDKSVRGFNLRASSGGSLTFTVVYGDERTRRTIGRYPIVTLAKARERAEAILAEHTLRGDKPPSIMFTEAFDRFITLHLKVKNKPSSAAATERLIRVHLLPKYEKKRLEDITPRSIADLIDELIDTPSECLHTYTAAKTFFRFCERRSYVTKSPLGSLEAPTRPVSRERVLSVAEVAVLWSTSHLGGKYGTLLRLLLLTGQRLSQIALLRPEYIDREAKTITWSGSVMKNSKPHTIPYGDVTAKLLDTLPSDGFLFPTRKRNSFTNWSNAHRLYLKASKMEHFTRHDLRRTYSTLQASIGTPLHITELLLSHRGGTISGVAAVYMRYNFAAEMRKAVETYEGYLATLTGS